MMLKGRSCVPWSHQLVDGLVDGDLDGPIKRSSDAGLRSSREPSTLRGDRHFWQNILDGSKGLQLLLRALAWRCLSRTTSCHMVPVLPDDHANYVIYDMRSPDLITNSIRRTHDYSALFIVERQDFVCHGFFMC